MDFFKPLLDQWNISFGSPRDPTISEDELYFTQVVQPTNDAAIILKGLSMLPLFTKMRRGTLKVLRNVSQSAEECVSFRFRMAPSGDPRLPLFDSCDEFLMGLLLLLMNEGFHDLQRGAARVVGLVLRVHAQVVDVQVLVSDPKLVHSLKSKLKLLL